MLGYRGGDLVQAGFDTPFADLFQTELLARHGVVPDQYLLERIRGRWFAGIVLDFDLETERNPQMLNMYLTLPVRDAIEQNYEIADQITVPTPERLNPQDRFYVYVPRPQGARPALSAATVRSAPQVDGARVAKTPSSATLPAGSGSADRSISF
jgi:hypothetical protein